MARRTREEAEQTRSLLLDTAEAVFWEKGVSRTSLADIAHAAGLTRGAIYWHFQNKADLFNAMCERIEAPFFALFDALEAEAAVDPARALWRHSRRVLETISGDAQISRVIGIVNLKCEFVDELDAIEVENVRWMERCHGHLTRAFEAAERAGQLSAGVEPCRAAAGLQAFIKGIVLIWLVTPHNLPLPGCGIACLSPYFQGVFQDACWLAEDDGDADSAL
ncbi:TetR family transcriptional regulator [Crenobacter cavernae]|uniref:TetR family transcriptional regulator n=1 Tax=Crenobacter cavernae TaxID=2290923 RepID=A0A345Y5H7_9NEIS|nr:TetR family transcriptional regulator [Crenobacter cavernae]AXK39179.1 TetR family transcriptional regulator [Crenobacter cavernae]RXZ44046.1 TetR family transcriptional regulator [Crenobacter cavernae]